MMTCLMEILLPFSYVDRLKKITPSGSKCRVPAASVNWAPEIPSALISSRSTPRKCELVHKSWSFVSKIAQASVRGAFYVPAKQPGIAPAMRGCCGLSKQTRQKLRDQLVANVRGEE